jgi:GTPase SAR1 family protein
MFIDLQFTTKHQKLIMLQLNVVVVGSVGVGKTTLIENLIGRDPNCECV